MGSTTQWVKTVVRCRLWPWRSFAKSEQLTPDDIIAMSSGLSQLGLEDYKLITKRQIGGVKFERRERLSGRKDPVQDATERHYGKCRTERFWSLTHTRD